MQWTILFTEAIWVPCSMSTKSVNVVIKGDAAEKRKHNLETILKIATAKSHPARTKTNLRYEANDSQQWTRFKVREIINHEESFAVQCLLPAPRLQCFIILLKMFVYCVTTILRKKLLLLLPYVQFTDKTIKSVL